jgi:ribosome-associated protein
MLQITATLAIDDREIDERFVRASGPGGQNVNKVATAVELRFDVNASSLPPDVKRRLVSLAGRRMTTEGVLLIDGREYRTQAQNRAAARDRLVALIRRATIVPVGRRPTTVSKGAKQRRLATKKQRAELKARRGRPSGDE